MGRAVCSGLFMSHLRPEDLVSLEKTSCRKGRHHYGKTQIIGGGITRQVCRVCGAVTIDLSAADDILGDIGSGADPRPKTRPTISSLGGS